MTPRAPSYGYPTLVVLLAATLVLTLLTVAYVKRQKRVAIKDKTTELMTIADLKSSQIRQWRRERLSQAAAIHSNRMMSHRIHDLLHGRDAGRAREELTFWMHSVCNAGGYRRVTLFTPGGNVVASIPDRKGTRQSHVRSLIADAATSREIIFSDFHRDEARGNVDLNLVIPIIYPSGNRVECIAVLALDIDPYAFLYPLIRSWPTPSASGETLLVRREGNDVLFLNDLRFRKESALSFTRPLGAGTMPATRAALGQEGNFEGIDYRGVPVNSAIRTIPGSPWSMVAKIDKAEIYAPVTHHLLHAAANCGMLVMSLWLGGYLWWLRKRDAYLRTLYETELKLNRDLRQAEAELQKAHEQLERRVTQRTRELSETNENLQRQIARREQLEQRLLDAKKLESIGQIAAGVAHEVRNPLNAILTITEALFREREFEDNPEYLPYREHIRNQVKRLVELMNDLLELGREIPASNLQQVRLHDLSVETLQLRRTSATPDGGVVMHADDRAVTALVLADRLKLQQAVINLLENADNNSPPGSEVRLTLRVREEGADQAETVSIQVRDRGRGIAADKLPRVFDPFYSDRKGGTGLGLSLVRHYIENMGGTVRIWNNEPPPGCTAEIRIPLMKEKQEDRK